MGAAGSAHLILPDELLLKISVFLPARDLASASRVNRQLHAVVTTDSLWRRLLQVDYPYCHTETHAPTTFYESYRSVAARYMPGRRALQGTFFAFRGEWFGRQGYHFHVQMLVEIAPESQLSDKDSGRVADVRGHLRWTLVEASDPSSPLASRVGQTGRELVTGSYQRPVQLLALLVYEKLNDGLVDIDEYQFTVAPDGLSLSGEPSIRHPSWRGALTMSYDAELDANGDALEPDDPQPPFLAASKIDPDEFFAAAMSQPFPGASEINPDILAAAMNWRL
eukprot:TRINITY_DN6146_c0_g1_i1.p2 TRINITY_DN6146_c0_g1~~TRINITY_DN6146_c0_g1_i1.p2  ORF type:complete len:280 (-),score=36.95 TRINITY_DN6146_c0_g1_i1:184-1023(-)